VLRRAMPHALAALVATVAVALTAPAARALSAMEMVQQAVRATERVEDYTADVSVAVDAPNLQIPRRTAKVYYKRPDKVHVESSGLTVLPRDALLLGNLAEHLEEYATAQFAGSGRIGDRRVRCVKLSPIEASDGSGRVLVWIDAERYLLLRSEIWRGQKRMLRVSFEHTLVDGRHWMPSRIVTELAAGALGGRDEGGTIELGFSGYRVNTGLSDSIFEESD